MLKTVHFAGIKSLLEVTLPLEQFTVIVGPNGCGKSTLLDQIAQLCAFSRSNRQAGPLGAAGVCLQNKNVDMYNTANANVEKVWEGVSVTDASYCLKMEKPDSKKDYYGRVNISINNGNERRTLDFSNVNTHSIPYENMIEKSFNWRAQRLAMVPSTIAVPSEVTLSELRPDGYGLPTLLKDLAADDTQVYLSLQEDLRKVVPHFRELKFSKGSRNNIPTHVLELVMRQGRVPVEQVSDGTLLALGFLTAIHHPSLPKILLMDDIDHGLHLSAQLELLKAIRAVLSLRPEVQIICTTHSPYFLHDVKVEEVRVMALDAEGHTVIKPLAEHPQIDEWRTAMTAGELWANLGEEWVLEQR